MVFYDSEDFKNLANFSRTSASFIPIVPKLLLSFPFDCYAGCFWQLLVARWCRWWIKAFLLQRIFGNASFRQNVKFWYSHPKQGLWGECKSLEGAAAQVHIRSFRFADYLFFFLISFVICTSRLSSVVWVKIRSGFVLYTNVAKLWGLREASRSRGTFTRVYKSFNAR